MLRIRTLYNLGLTFTSRNLSFVYGFDGETTYTEYGYVVGYSNIETVNSQSFYTLNGNGEYSTKAATINFVTTSANQQVTFTIRSSSSNNDYMCIGNLDSDSINVAAAKICGINQQTTYTYTVATPGAHYIKAFYKKGAPISNSSADKGYVRMTPFTNSKDTTNVDTETVRINARKTWSVSSKPDWISLSQSTGATGITDVIITASVNTTSNQRSGIITIVDEKDKEYELEVVQAKSPNRVILSRDAMYETSDGNNDKFTVTLSGNTSWSVSGYSGDSNNYFSLSPTSGTNGTQVTVTWNKNTSKTTSKSTDVYIKGNLGGSDKIKIYQEKYYCSCDCNRNCTCDCDTYCLRDYTNKCTCDCNVNCSCNSKTNCTCNTQTMCNNCKVYCPSDTCKCDCNVNCSCTCKKEEEKQEEQKVKKSLWEKIKDIFD